MLFSVHLCIFVTNVVNHQLSMISYIYRGKTDIFGLFSAEMIATKDFLGNNP